MSEFIVNVVEALADLNDDMANLRDIELVKNHSVDISEMLLDVLINYVSSKG